MNLPRRFYSACYALAAGLFVAAEVMALRDPDLQDTFTAHVRPVVQRHSFLRFITAGFLSWLLYHFVFEQGSV